MGKKGLNKEPPVAATGSPAVVQVEAQSSWLDALTPEDRKLAVSVGCNSPCDLEKEKARLLELSKKAAEQQKKQLWENERHRQWEKEAEKKVREKGREDRKWEQQAEKAKQRALQEGVLESEDWGDDKWWLKVDGGYKEVQGQYYCTFCDKHLNDSTLEGHIDGKDHKKKASWHMPQQAPATIAPAVAVAKSPVLKPGYVAPALPYLAWVPADDTKPAGERWLKCLLCQKWVQDESSHIGTQQNPAGSKEHVKNLRNYGPGDEWYEQTVVRERLRFHPETSSRGPGGPPTVSAPTSARPAFQATQAPWAKQPPAPSPLLVPAG